MTVTLAQVLARLTPKHRTGLEWFIAKAGKNEPWPQPLGGFGTRGEAQDAANCM